MSKSKIFFFAIPSVVPMIHMVKFLYDNNPHGWICARLHILWYQAHNCLMLNIPLSHIFHYNISLFFFFNGRYISYPIFLFFSRSTALVKFLFILVRCRHSFLFDVSVVSATFWYSASKHLLWLYSTAKVHKCFYDKHRTLNINLIHSYSITPCKWNTRYYSIWHIPIYTL